MNAADELDNFLSITSSQFENVLITGDLNVVNLLATDKTAVVI